LRVYFGRIAWRGNETVRVTQDDGRDYWVCSTGGRVTFRYPRADSGERTALVALGRMSYEGRVVLADRERGVQLVRQAADKGDKHAVAFLRRVAEASGVTANE
jgi:TPR repeat protein